MLLEWSSSMLAMSVVYDIEITSMRVILKQQFLFLSLNAILASDHNILILLSSYIKRRIHPPLASPFWTAAIENATSSNKVLY